MTTLDEIIEEKISAALVEVRVIVQGIANISEATLSNQMETFRDEVKELRDAMNVSFNCLEQDNEDRTRREERDKGVRQA